jgi:hypothetical protein
MKRIIITEGQLRLLFEQGINPNTSVRSGDSISDADAVAQLQDGNGEVYAIELGSDKTTKASDCATKPNISGIVTLLSGAGVSSSDYTSDYSSHNKGCYVLYKSPTKTDSGIGKLNGTWWDNNNFFLEMGLDKNNWFSLDQISNKPTDSDKQVISISYLGRYNIDEGRYSHLQIKGYQYYDRGVKRYNSSKHVELQSGVKTNEIFAETGELTDIINAIKSM